MLLYFMLIPYGDSDFRAFFVRLWKSFFPALIIFQCTVGGTFADEPKTVASQWKLCWQNDFPEGVAAQPTADAGSLFLPLTGGKLLALNLTDGSIIWRTELGGEIIGEIPVGANHLFAASQIAETADKKASVVIRALSLKTGLTAWQSNFPQTSRVALAVYQNLLLITLDKRKIVALSETDGAVLWEKTLPADLSAAAAFAADAVYLATNDKRLTALRIADGAEIRRFELKSAANGQIRITTGEIFISDAVGNLTVWRETDGKKLWATRFGGAVQEIAPVKENVLISSLDGFVYFHRRAGGKRLWRKRLSNRPRGVTLIDENSALLTLSGENNAIVIGFDKGKLLNQLSFGAENYAVAMPLRIGNLLLVATRQGVLTFAPVAAACPEKRKSET